MAFSSKNKGFSIVEAVLGIVIVAAIAFAVMNVMNNKDATETTTGDATSSELDQTEQGLDNINLDELDTTELDALEEELL